MSQPEPLNSPELQSKALIWLVIIVTVLFALVLRPLSGALLWAVFLAIVFWSLQERSLQVCHGRRGWAAFGTLVAISVSVVLPTLLLIVAITHEATAFYDRFKSGDVQLGRSLQHAIDLLPAWARPWLERMDIADLGVLQRKFVELVGRSSQAITTHVFTIGQNTVEFVLDFFVMLYVLFFLLRDGRDLAAEAVRVLPLRTEYTQRLFRKFAAVVRATVKGNVVIAIAQGTLGGLALWVIGIAAPLLWGALMAVLSLVPAIGVALVWVPIALYLLATGALWSALGLTAWCVLVIGLVDNVLRPVLVGKETRLPDYLVLVATLGGLTAFGVNGFVIGPAIAALFLSSWDIFSQARQEQRSAPPREPPGGHPPVS
ncbi:MAG TPA: AI-2E family transporter [Ramlibacter sp.]|nr:AI-2E family transporter [Ramlibacter sp.]